MTDMTGALDLPAAGVPAILLLTETIEQQPDEPVNYLLRGEAWLRAGDRRRAADDFVMARDLAARRFAQSAWGYLDQAYCDRAQAGLAACQGALPAGVPLEDEDQARREARRIVEADSL
ncbi:MAG: hypothetical protein AAGU78_06620 [Chloroflexota bacterium]|nr:hypothetical protein [Anaerolineae bacterium]HMM27256.1 hypothetical protein [Aggregatilineaceae bacterium]